MFIHVPSAWLAMFGYMLIAVAALGTLIWRHPLADVAAKTAAPIGATFTFIALVTGSLWGKPMWGTYWVWDARLTSVLILFLLYLGLIALWQSIEEPGRAGRAAAILALVGAVNVPIIHYSVVWWNTLHQPASVFRIGGPSIDPALLTPLFVMAIAFTLLFVLLHLIAMRAEILRRRVRALQQSASRARRSGRGLSHARPRPARLLHHRRLCRDLRGGGRACLVHRRGRSQAAAHPRRARAQGHQAALGRAEAHAGQAEIEAEGRRMSEATRAPILRRFGLALPLLLFAVLAGLFWYALHAGDPSLLPSPLIGKPVPNFTLPPIDGLSADGAAVPGFASGDLAQGEPTIVNVFASWCVECQVEHPALLALSQEPGIRLYGIDYKDDMASARRFLGRNGNPYARVGADASGRTAIDFGVYGVPETYVVTGDGKIAYRHVGPLTESAIRDKILPLLTPLRAAANAICGWR